MTDDNNPYNWNITWSGGSDGHTPIVMTASTSDLSQVHHIPVSLTPKLFGNWIEKTKYLQEEFYGHKFEDFTHDELVQWVRINVLAAEDELHETLGEISWKPWASAQYFNREAYIGEIVDVLHFVANLLAGAGVTDEELNAAYLEKMERNRQRQREGYTGTDKCSKCSRAADDVVAHGGYMKMWHVPATYDGISTNYDSKDVYGCNRCFGEPGDEYK
jgi:dimeric dUTPase (all-alpha-NTP-PPase superfamily)